MPTSQMTVYQEREGLSSKMPFINQVTGRCSQKYCLIAECDNWRECGAGSVDSTISQTLSEERHKKFQTIINGGLAHVQMFLLTAC